MDVADDAEGLGNQVFAQRDVVDGSPPLEAQARGGDQQVRGEGGLEGCPKAEWCCTALPDPLVEVSHHDEARSGSPFQQSGETSEILLVVLPCVPVPARTHARAGPGNADADDRHLTNTGLGDAGHESPGRQCFVANSIHGLPALSGPQQDLPSALLTLSEGLPPVGLGADGVAIRRQGQTCRVGLGETDDVRGVLSNAALQLRRFPLGRGPFDIPVEQFQRHGASFPRTAW